ncbi:MAG TPA: hemerythrin domain-containing protein [Ktedonobacterales bacterium]
MDILSRLSQDHEELRALLAGIEAAAETQDSAALIARLDSSRAALTRDLDAHIDVEEAEAFDAIASALGDGLVAPFYEDHIEIKAARDVIYAELARGQTPYEAALRLCALIDSHQRREDLMLFPSARESAFS